MNVLGEKRNEVSGSGSGAYRAPEDFEQAVKKLGLLRFNIHDCSLCGYPCGFVFNHGRIAYDSGCDCVTYGPVIDERKWSDLSDHYNAQKNTAYRTEMDNFFGFSSSPSSSSASLEK